ncbi:Uricase-2 isozyme 1 isoform B [Glycine soja]|uniref:Uricase n=1 Tax=Glycine soja TaxID=3848 RepID=A0A445ILD7_GLYSO|nr:Uricase-2 isozyme 1 isoform B [Glycine soja]
MAKQEVVEGFKFEQRHGKERVRVARVWKTRQGQHFIVEWRVGITLFSDCVNSYLRDDNSDIVATDTMKNTVYAKAKECSDILSAEEFAILLAKHFVSFYQKVTGAIVNIVEKPWERVTVDGQPHEHGFKLGSEKHTTEAIVQKSGSLQLTSGIEGLSVLKTTQYTALPDTRERMVATEVTALWRYSYESLYSLPQKPLYFTEKYQEVKKVLADTFFGPPKGGVYSPSVQNTLYLMAKATLNRFPDIAYVSLKLPNLHFIPVNISNQDGPIVKFEDDVYLPTDEPHGSIQASLSRLWSKL